MTVPSHFYWDGRYFPTHCSSFGVIDVSTTPPYEDYVSPPLSPSEGTKVGNQLIDWDDVLDDDWIDTNPHFVPVSSEQPSSILSPSDDHTIVGNERKKKESKLDLDDKHDNCPNQKKQEKVSTSLISGLQQDMIILFQKFGYYYLSSCVDHVMIGDRFGELDKDDEFIIKLPSQSICASKSILKSESTFFKVMIESDMKEAAENQVDFTCSSSEEELDIIRIVNFIRFGHVGVPIKGTAFPTNLDNFGNELIGIGDLLRLLDTADKFGVLSFVRSIPFILHQYNAMIILEKAFQITPELGTIIIDECIHVIARYLPSVLGGLIYEGGLEEFVQQIPSRVELWNLQCRETFLIFRKLSTIDMESQSKLNRLYELKTFPIVNYLVEVLPCDIFLKVLISSELQIDDLLEIVTLWIMSSSFDSCFLECSSLDNLEKDNMIYRLKEGLTLILDNLEIRKMSKENVFLMLHPIVRYYSRSLPEELKQIVCKYSIVTAQSMGTFHSSTSFTDKVISPMFEKFIETSMNQHTTLDPYTNSLELFSQLFLEEYDYSIVPQMFYQVKMNDPAIFSNIVHAFSFSLASQFENIQFANSKGLKEKNETRRKSSKPTKVFEVCFVGLDEAGKTLLLEKIKDPNSGKINVTIPTIGFNSETISFEGAPINIVDIGGSAKIRGLWSNFISSKCMDLLIMVVDLSNRERFTEAKDSFDKLMDNMKKNVEHAKPLSILLLASKVDCVQEISLRESHESELFSIFQTSPHLSSITLNHGEPGNKQNRFHYLSCSAKTGEGIKEMWAWFLENELIGEYVATERKYFGSLLHTHQ